MQRSQSFGRIAVPSSPKGERGSPKGTKRTNGVAGSREKADGGGGGSPGATPGVMPFWPASPGGLPAATSPAGRRKGPQGKAASGEAGAEVPTPGQPREATSAEVEGLQDELRTARERIAGLANGRELRRSQSEAAWQREREELVGAREVAERQLAAREETVKGLRAALEERDALRRAVEGQVAALRAEKDALESSQAELSRQLAEILEGSAEKGAAGEDASATQALEEVERLRQEVASLQEEKTRARRAAEVAGKALTQAVEQRKEAQAGAEEEMRQLREEVETLRRERREFTEQTLGGGPREEAGKGASGEGCPRGGPGGAASDESLAEPTADDGSRVAALERQLAAEGATRERLAAEWRAQKRELSAELAEREEELARTRRQLAGGGGGGGGGSGGSGGEGLGSPRDNVQLAALGRETGDAERRVEELSLEVRELAGKLAESQALIATLSLRAKDVAMDRPEEGGTEGEEPAEGAATVTESAPKYLVQELQRKNDELVRKDEELVRVRKEMEVLRAKMDEAEGKGGGMVEAIFPWSICMRKAGGGE